MIHVFYGEDELAIEEALASLMETVGPAELREVNVTVLEGEGLSPQDLLGHCATAPFLAGRRLVVVKGLLGRFQVPGGRRGRSAPSLGPWEGLPGALASVPETTDLVFVDGPLDRSNPLLARLAPVAEVRTFPLPRGPQLQRWLMERAQAKGARLTPEAATVLMEMVGPDLRVLDGELEKLALYCGDRPVGRQDVEDLVSYVREASVFAAVDAAVEGRLEAALRHLHRLMAGGTTAPQLLALLARQVRLLLLAKDLRSQGLSREEIGRRLRLAGFLLRKVMEQGARLTHDELVAMYRAIVQADLALKSGPVEEAVVLDLLVTALAGEGRAQSRRMGL